MIDYFSATITGVRLDDLISQFEFIDNINLKTGEIVVDKYGTITKTANIGELQLQVRIASQNNFKIYLKGSIHKYHTGNYISEGYNYSDFGYSDICDAINHITDVINIEPSQIKLHQLEFGLNIKTKENPSFIIEQILSHKGRSFEQRDYLGNGHLIRFNRERYSIKIYNKGLQYGLQQNLLRIEIKVNKMAYFEGVIFNKFEISNMDNLMHLKLYDSFFNALINILGELILTDDRISPVKISNTKHRAFFTSASNSRYWSKLRNLSDSKTFKRTSRRFEDIRIKYAPDDLKFQLQEELISKFNEIIKNVPFSPLSKTTKKSDFHTHIGSEYNTPLRRCVACGRDISIQKTNSLFCSELRFGSKVKQCRNIISNLKVREKRYYPQQTLFNVDFFLTPELQRLKSIAFKSLI
jgi:hypothetical protein